MGTTHFSRAHDASYRPDIDGLRALAVLAVVAYHAVPGWVPGGFVGVDVFFVISGFLISKIIFADIRQGTFSFRRFYARRIRRLFPALVLVLVAVWVLGWFLLLPAGFRRLGRDIVAVAGFGSNIVFSHDIGYFEDSARLQPLLHLWSLGVEEQYYLLWPLTVFLACKFRQGLPALIVLAGIASFAANVGTSRPAAAFYLPQVRFWELLAGGAIAYAQVFRGHGETVRWCNSLAVAGLVLLAIAVFRLDETLRFPGWWALLPVTATAMLIVAGPPALLNRYVLSAPPCVLIGLISYPLYLWHWPLLSLARIVTQGEPGGATIAGLVAISFALAGLTYAWVELPIRGAQVRLPATRVAAVLALALAVVGGLGIGTWANAGFPARFPPVLDDTSLSATSGSYRVNACFVNLRRGLATFADACLDPPGPAASPLLVLWGDSHAAHLFPGLRELQTREPFRLGQYTVVACPPYLDMDVPNRPFCRESNTEILQRIATLRPDWVVLSALWVAYQSLPGAALDRTVDALRDIGVKTIVVVGPDPNWRRGLVRMLYDHYREDGTIPWRIDYAAGLPRPLDQQMREHSERLGARYVSLVDILCNTDGCLTRVGDLPGDVTFWDETHLSVAGSRFVVEHFPQDLFGAAAK